MANNNDKYKNHSREELIDELETLKKKKYGLIWDKKNSQEMLDVFVNWENVPENFTPKQFPILKEVKNKEIETDKSKSTNLLIEGDNYHSLAVLNFTHQNKIDVIYIDPPYNTGNKDFIYNDKFIDKEDPFRHSKWLSFMEKRLRLAHRLLKNTGVIFISIDDHEQAQLKLLCDEIFGEKNFVQLFVWHKKTQPSFLSKEVANVSEYLLCYRKNEYLKLKGGLTDADKAVELLNISNGVCKRILPANRTIIKNEKYSGIIKAGVYGNGELKIILEKDLQITNGISNNDIELTGRFKWSQDKINYEVIDGANIFIKSITTLRPTLKRTNGQQNIKPPISILSKYLNNIPTNTDASNELKEMFGGTSPMDFPKPVGLIKYLIEAKTFEDKNSIILDFFAGSGTTGQAVLELNKKDNGSRKFILCTNNENNICSDVCYPRIEKVINGYKNPKGEKVAGLGGNLKYFKTDFVSSDSTDKNKRDLVNKSTEMICIKENIFDLVADGGLDYRIYQKGKKFLGVIFEIDAVADFKKEAEKHKGNFTVYCFSYTEATPEKEFKGLKNKYILKPIPAVILRIYLEIFKK